MTGGEGQSSDSEEFTIAQPPYCLEQQKLTTNRMAHSCKINSNSTEKLLLRNLSKDTEDLDDNFRKKAEAPEVTDKGKEVVKGPNTENAKTVFHSHPTLESPQTSRIGGDFLGSLSLGCKS